MISIIIPVFNQAEKISRTLDSIIGQQEKDLEVIIVNDGSKDNIQEILIDYQEKFQQAEIPYQFFNQENQGAPAARNRGFKASTGDFLLFCDADAILKPNSLATMKQTLISHPEAAYVYSSFLWGSKLFKIGAFSDERLKSAPFIHTMSLIRREAYPLSGWDESIKKLQDWDLWLTMLEAGHKGYWIDKILFVVSPGGNISSWLPSFAYKLFPFLPQVKKYKNAVARIKAKHNLT